MKRWLQLLTCLLISAGIWLIHNLSQQYESIVSVPVVAVSNIYGRASKSTSDATITAQVKASGFRLARLARRKSIVEVELNASDFKRENGDLFSIQNQSLFKYASGIFGDEVVLESFISEDLKFTFPEETFKKVPVVKVHSISFRSQYMALSEMDVQPDSVLVYGEVSRLENIESVQTKPLEFRDLHTNVNGKVKLEVPSGVRLSETEAIYSMEVSRYVEIQSEVRIKTRNVPSGLEFAVLPSTATAVFRCVFPTSSNPAGKVGFYVDYRDFAESLSGRCMAHAEGVPSNVISYSLSPEVFDCLVK